MEAPELTVVRFGPEVGHRPQHLAQEVHHSGNVEELHPQRKELGDVIDAGQAALLIVGENTMEDAIDKAALKSQKQGSPGGGKEAELILHQRCHFDNSSGIAGLQVWCPTWLYRRPGVSGSGSLKSSPGVGYKRRTMTTEHFDDLTIHQKRRLIVRAVLRTMITLAVVVAVYFVIPMDRPIDTATVVELVVGILLLFAVIVWQIWQIWQIIRSKHPGIRAVEGLEFSLPLFILLFATTYYLMDHANATTFAQPLTRIDSMYFSATVFTTVGFGDITARGQGARVLVTIQMMLDLVVVGLVVRLVVNAVKVGRQRQS